MSEHDVMAKCTAQIASLQNDKARLTRALEKVDRLLHQGANYHQYLPVNAQHARDVIREALAPDTGD
jgi:hypothetical protein